ncbi:MAG: universal stress protein, partial [Deltaproteobacteria bacterium]|nr:universal stress protein [Deltaproteobacteria bacterium]
MLPRRILHCTDFSDNSGPALKCALEYAQAFEAELLILHVIDTWAGLPAYEEGFYVQVREAFAQTEQSSAAKLESMQADCERLTRKVRTFT